MIFSIYGILGVFLFGVGVGVIADTLLHVRWFRQRALGPPPWLIISREAVEQAERAERARDEHAARR